MNGWDVNPATQSQNAKRHNACVTKSGSLLTRDRSQSDAEQRQEQEKLGSMAIVHDQDYLAICEDCKRLQSLPGLLGSSLKLVNLSIWTSSKESLKL